MSDADKTRENRLRRAARRQGFVLRKSRRRDPEAYDYGLWMIVDPDGNTVVAGNQATGTPSMPLDGVEYWLWGGEDRCAALRQSRTSRPVGSTRAKIMELTRPAPGPATPYDGRATLN